MTNTISKDLNTKFSRDTAEQSPSSENPAPPATDTRQTTNEKFGKLYISYSTFMVGLVVSVVLLVVVRQLVAFV